MGWLTDSSDGRCYHWPGLICLTLRHFVDALLLTGLQNPIDTMYHLQPLMFLGLFPLFLYNEGLLWVLFFLFFFLLKNCLFITFFFYLHGHWAVRQTCMFYHRYSHIGIFDAYDPIHVTCMKAPSFIRSPSD